MENNQEMVENIIELIEVLFQSFGIHRINIENLTDITNEFNLFKILQEIEPELLSITEMEDLQLKKDAKKLDNLKLLFDCLSKYFELCPNKSRLIKNFKFEKLVSLDGLVKLNEKDLITFGGMILLLSAVSTKRSEYLDTLYVLSETETRYLDNYFHILESYLIFDKEESNANILNSSISNLKGFGTQKMSLARKTSITKRMSMKNKDQNKMAMNFEVFEEEIANLNKKNQEVTNELLDLELRYRDVLRENESLKQSLNSHFQFEEEAFNDTVTISHLKNELMKKELEIEDIKRDHELSKKRLKADMQKLVTQKDSLEDKLDELKSIKYENEKLKLKIKELNLNKDKLNDYDNMVLLIEGKNKQIEALIKEKQGLFQQTEKLMKENHYDKEKLKEVEHEKKKLEYEVQDLKSDNRNFSRRGTFNFDKTQNIKTANSNNLNFSARNSGLLLENIQDTLQEMTMIPNKEEIENEFADVLQELEEMKKMYKEQVEINQKIIDEKGELENKINKLLLDFEQQKTEVDKLIIEKEKVEISKQKIELDLNKLSLNIDKNESEKHKLIDEINQIKNKNDYISEERNSQVKEIESLKISLKQKNNQIDKILSEKQKLVNDYQNLLVNSNQPTSPENKFSAKNVKSVKNVSVTQPSPKHANNTTNTPEINELKSEIAKCRASMISKDEQIKQLKERIKHIEKMESIVKSQELKKENDLIYYKKSFEEQKKLMNQEHEVLSTNLCDLANQFVVFKNELLKNVKPSILQQNNIN